MKNEIVRRQNLISAANNTFDVISDSGKNLLVMGSYGRALCCGNTTESAIGGATRKLDRFRFRDIDVINTADQLNPPFSKYQAEHFLPIDMILCRSIRPIESDPDSWGIYNHRVSFNEPLATFALEALGITSRRFSRDSDKTVNTPDARSLVLMQEIFSRTIGVPMKHSAQYEFLKNNEAQLSADCDHSSLEKAVADATRILDKYSASLSLQTRTKNFLGHLVPKIAQILIDLKNRAKVVYHPPKHFDNMTDLLSRTRTTNVDSNTDYQNLLFSKIREL